MAIITFAKQPKLSLRRFELRPPEKFASWLKSAQSDKYFLGYLVVWLLALLLMLIVILATFSSLPSQIPLFYSRVWGERQLAPKVFIYLPPIGTFLLGIFNLAIGTTFHERDKIIAYLLAGTASLVSVLSAITVINIIRLLL